jgi:hypothetical protein
MIAEKFRRTLACAAHIILMPLGTQHSALSTQHFNSLQCLRVSSTRIEPTIACSTLV